MSKRIELGDNVGLLDRTFNDVLGQMQDFVAGIEWTLSLFNHFLYQNRLSSPKPFGGNTDDDNSDGVNETIPPKIGDIGEKYINVQFVQNSGNELLRALAAVDNRLYPESIGNLSNLVKNDAANGLLDTDNLEMPLIRIVGEGGIGKSIEYLKGVENGGEFGVWDATMLTKRIIDLGFQETFFGSGKLGLDLKQAEPFVNNDRGTRFGALANTKERFTRQTEILPLFLEKMQQEKMSQATELVVNDNVRHLLAANENTLHTKSLLSAGIEFDLPAKLGIGIENLQMIGRDSVSGLKAAFGQPEQNGEQGAEAQHVIQFGIEPKPFVNRGDETGYFRSDESKQVSKRVDGVGGKTINLNRALVEQLTINVNGAQEGANQLRQRIEAVLLEVLGL